MMSDKHTKDIVDAVEQNEVYLKTVSAISDDEKENVKATLEGFAKLLSPVVQALDELENSDEIAQAVRARLAEKLGGR